MANKEQIEAEIKRLQKLLPTMRMSGYIYEQCQGRIDGLIWVLGKKD